MPDAIQSFKLICSGGLNSNENHLDLSDNGPGSASRLLNYEPSLFGGYRRIEGFDEYDTDYGEVTVAGSSTGQGKVLGIVIFKNDVTGGSTIIAARQDASATTYSFYYYTANVGWRKFTLNHSATRSMTANGLTVNRLRHVQFNFGTGNKIVFVDGVNEAIIFDGAPSLVDVFENHLFLSGHTATGAAIAYSKPNDPYTWTSAAGAGQVTAGFDVVQIKPFRDNLFVFGSKDIKKITVNSSNAFVIENVTTNVGCCG